MSAEDYSKEDIENELLKTTVRTEFYDRVDDILFNLDSVSRFIWIIGPKGSGKTHALGYIKHKLLKDKETCVIKINFRENRWDNDIIKSFTDTVIDYLKKKYPKLKNYLSDDLCVASKKISNLYGIKRYILTIDDMEKEEEFFKKFFSTYNQGLFESLIQYGYFFIVSATDNLIENLDVDFFSGENIRLEAFQSGGMIRNVVKAVCKNVDPTPQACITILEKTRGNPMLVVREAKKLEEEEERLDALNNKFIVENRKEIDDITHKFSITNFYEDIVQWLRIFPEIKDKYLALKILTFMDYYDGDDIRRALFEGYNSIIKEVSPKDEWGEIAICPASSLGKSGGYLTYRLKRVANLSDNQFINIDMLDEKFVKNKKAIIFVDDFIGTGNQCVELWNKIHDIARYTRLYLLVLYSLEKGLDRVKRKTGFKIVYDKVVNNEKLIFSEKNKFFSEAEKERILQICEYIGGKDYLGYENSQACIAFEHTTPNNTIVLLRGNRNFRGLFSRMGVYSYD